jgi:4-amino-4-deoxy-L-arabinose transferase-like glycosyltransferase
MSKGRSAQTLAEVLLLAVFCAFLFFFGLPGIGLAGADEPRYAQIAREMLARRDWITPLLHGRPWLEKPVLYYWEAMLAYRACGVSDWAARLPSAINATLLVFAIYIFLGARFRSGSNGPRRPGPVALADGREVIAAGRLDAALMAASCAFVTGFARAASMDMLLTANLGIALLAWAHAMDRMDRMDEMDDLGRMDKAGAVRPAQAAPYATAAMPTAATGACREQSEGSTLSTPSTSSTKSTVSLLAFYFFLALATLAKGPIAPLLAALIIAVFALLCRDHRIIRRTLNWAGILLFCAVAAPWYALVQWRTGNFFRVFLLEHNLERFATPVYHHTRPFWYFLPLVLLAVAPWTVISVAALARAVVRDWGWAARRRPSPGHQDNGPGLASDSRQPTTGANGRRLRAFLAVWALVPVVFFSFSNSKLPGYILPSIPPLAILAALWLREKMAREDSLPFVLLLLHGMVAGALLSAVLLSSYFALRLHPPPLAVGIAVGAGIVMAVFVVAVVGRRGLRTVRFATLLPVLLGLAFLLRVAAPVLDRQFSARPVSEELGNVTPAGAPLAGFAISREIEYGLGFYLDRPVARYERGEVPGAGHVLLTPDSAEELEARFPRLRFTVLGSSAAQDLRFYWVSLR